MREVNPRFDREKPDGRSAVRLAFYRLQRLLFLRFQAPHWSLRAAQRDFTPAETQERRRRRSERRDAHISTPAPHKENYQTDAGGWSNTSDISAANSSLTRFTRGCSFICEHPATINRSEQVDHFVLYTVTCNSHSFRSCLLGWLGKNAHGYVNKQPALSYFYIYTGPH